MGRDYFGVLWCQSEARDEQKLLRGLWGVQEGKEKDAGERERVTAVRTFKHGQALRV